MGDTKNEAPKSALVQWLEARPRWYKDVDVAGAGLVNHDGSPIGRLRIYINTKADDNDAIMCAYRDAEKLSQTYTKTSAEEARRDPDFIEDLKTAHALWRACRNIDDPKWSAFWSPEWMTKNLNSHAIGYLLNVYNACKLEEAHLQPQYERERVEVYRDAVCSAWNSTQPDLLFAALPREHLMAIALQAMRHWRDDVDKLTERVDELELQASAAEAIATES